MAGMLRVDSLVGTHSWTDFKYSFGAHLARVNGRTFIIDTGPRGAAESLLDQVWRLGVTQVDYILLSHIHLDHAGGLPVLFAAFPGLQAVVHDKGLQHLVNPNRLWESTKEVVRGLGGLYGPLEPIDSNRLISHLRADIPGVAIIETPGHAPHHLSYVLDDEVIFVGEAGGCPLMVDGRLHCQPATPPRYNPAITFGSVDRLLREPDRTAWFGHGLTEIPFRKGLTAYREQLQLWDTVLNRPESAQKVDESREDYLERLVQILFAEDPNYGELSLFSSGAVKHFAKTAIEGFLQYYEERERE